MVAEQREAGHAVVEENIFLPRNFVVAVGTVFTHGTLVRVVVLVAIQAAGRGRNLKQWIEMTLSLIHI